MALDTPNEALPQPQEETEHPRTRDAEYRRRVLQERARALSKPRRAQRSETAERILVFQSGAERYGIPLQDVVEVVANAQLTVVPGTPPRVAGLIQFRGEIRPVYYLEKLLDPGRAASDGVNLVMLLRGRSGEFGVLANDVEGIREVPAAARRAAPPTTACTLWATEDLIPVLDVSSLSGGK
jgi:purine-binding chemotaxis protein CheW